MFHSFFMRMREQIEVKQAIKTALAAVLSLFLCIELDLVIPRPQILISGLWCVVASIVGFTDLCRRNL
jgi:hypothetical protein